MYRARCICVDAPWIEEVRADIRQRPFLQELADRVVCWERYADAAPAVGRLAWAAACQEHAATTAHRLGLLEGALLDIAPGRRAASDLLEDDGFST